MEFQGKALFNLIKMHWERDPTLSVKPWQVEDYRSLSDKELFSRLEKLKVYLDKVKLEKFVSSFETPEELANHLAGKHLQEEEYDRVYLIIFELWRRHFPEKATLSIFCEELDYLILSYDQDKEKQNELVFEQLKNLINVLDINVDHGADPQMTFKQVSSYAANDLERFIYDFINDQIENGNELIASELLDGFYEYVGHETWFDLLKMRLIALTDVDEANFMLSRIIELLPESKDFFLFHEVLRYLLKTGLLEMFQIIVALPNLFGLIKMESDFKQLLLLLKDYFHLIKKEKERRIVSNLLKQRQDLDPRSQFSSKEDFQELEKVFKGFSSE